MAKFNELLTLIDSIVEKKYRDDEKKTDRAYQSIEKQKDRDYAKELRILDQQFNLQQTLLSESRNDLRNAESDYEDQVNNYNDSVGELPSESGTYKNALHVVNQSLGEGITDSKDALQLFNKKTNIIEAENKRIQNVLSTTVSKANNYLNVNFPEYANSVIDNDIIDPIEFALLESDKKMKERNTTIDGLMDAISLNETGSRASENNNAGAMNYSPWMKKYGATKNVDDPYWTALDANGDKVKDIFSQEEADALKASGQAVNKHFTATFPNSGAGEAALRELISTKWASTSGNLSEFTSSYTGLKEGTAEHTNYMKILDTIDVMTQEESNISSNVLKRSYFNSDHPTRMRDIKAMRLEKGGRIKADGTMYLAELQTMIGLDDDITSTDNRDHRAEILKFLENNNMDLKNNKIALTPDANVNPETGLPDNNYDGKMSFGDHHLDYITQLFNAVTPGDFDKILNQKTTKDINYKRTAAMILQHLSDSDKSFQNVLNGLQDSTIDFENTMNPAKYAGTLDVLEGLIDKHPAIDGKLDSLVMAYSEKILGVPSSVKRLFQNEMRENVVAKYGIDGWKVFKETLMIPNTNEDGDDTKSSSYLDENIINLVDNDQIDIQDIVREVDRSQDTSVENEDLTSEYWENYFYGDGNV